MKPYELAEHYPRDNFATEAGAQVWAAWAAPHLDKRDYNRVEQRGERFVVVQDIRP